MRALVTVVLAITAAPMLLLTLAGWAILRILGLTPADVSPRPVESERDAALAGEPLCSRRSMAAIGAGRSMPAGACGKWMLN